MFRVAAFGLALVVASAHAQAISWNGGSADWNTMTSWSSGTVPGASDDVTINAAGGSTVTISTAQFCHTLTIGGGTAAQTLTITPSGGSLTIGVSATIQTLGSLTVSGGTTVTNTGATINVNANGTLTNNGTITGGTIAVAAAGTLDISIGSLSGVTVNNSGLVQWTSSNTDLSNGSALNILSSGGFLISTGGMITTTGGASVVNSGVLTLSGNNPLTFNPGVSLTNNGTLDVNTAGAVLSVNTFTNYTTAPDTLTGGIYTLTGSLQLLNGAVTGHSIANNAANIVLNGTSAGILDSSSQSMLSGFANNTATGQLTLSGGLSINATGAITSAGVISLSGTGTSLSVASGNFTQTASGTTDLAGGAQLGAPSGTVALQGGTFVLSTTSNINAPVNNSGCQILVGAGQTLNISGNYTQGVGGSLFSDITSPTQVGLVAVSGTANLNGSVTAAVSYTPSLGDSFQVMTYTSVVGQFSSVLPPTLTGGLALSQSVGAGGITLKVVNPPPKPVISSVTASLPVVETGTPVTFTATASDPSSLPLTYIWNFGDGSPQANGNPVTYSYSIEGAFVATVTVSNGTTSAQGSVTITTFAPNSGGQGIVNISQGQPEVIDPLTMLGISVMSSNGGVIQLNIDTDNLRAAFDVSTEFDGIGIRSNPVAGNNPVNKFVAPGVFVANATATDPATNALKGKGRKTLAISGAEVGQPPDIKNPPHSQGISKAKLKGKFSFTNADTLGPLAAGGLDSVSLSGVIELPEGFDLSVSHEFDIAIGNIIDALTVSSKGTAKLPGSANVIKKLTVKYPKSKSGTRTSAGQIATVTISMAGSNFSKNGFDTEGITNNVTTAEKAAKSINRSIQVAIVVGGTAYQFSAPVSFKLSKDSSSGTIGTRTGQ
jgi:hypothetical protein